MDAAQLTVGTPVDVFDTVGDDPIDLGTITHFLDAGTDAWAGLVVVALFLPTPAATHVVVHLDQLQAIA